MRRAGAALAVLALLVPRLALADRALEDLLAKVVRARYEALHGCFRRSLSEDRSRGGTIYVRLTIGSGGSVSHTKLERDELKHQPTVNCLLSEVRQWTLSNIAGVGVDEGSELVLPLTFRADPLQRIVAQKDVTAHAVGEGAEAQVLLGQKNVGVTDASMTMLRVQKKVSLPCINGVAQVVMVLKGRGRVSGGGRSRSLRPGAALLLARGKGADIRRRGRQPLELLHFFVRGAEQHWLQAPPPSSKCQQLPRRSRLPLRGSGFVLGRITKRSRLWTGARLIYVTRGSAQMPSGRFVRAGQAVYLANTERLQPGKRFGGIRLFVTGTVHDQRPENAPKR